MTYKYDEKTSRATEKAYQAPQIAQQREATLRTINPAAGECGLDVGCGPGMLLAKLAEAVGPRGHVTGVDLSQSMLELAGARCEGLSQVALRQGSATALPLDDAAFDFVTCVQVLLYVDDVALALDEMRRVLRPGGRVYVMETDWRSAVLNCDDPGTADSVFGAWDKTVSSPNLPIRLQALLSQARFRDVAVQVVPLLSTTMDEYAGAMLKQLAREACTQGVMSRDQADRWWAQLKALDKAGEFFFCVNRFAFSASVRD